MANSNATSGLAQRMAMRQVEASMSKEKSAPQDSKQYEDAIREFLKDSGHLICVSDDVALTDMLRGVLNDSLGLPADKISIAHDADMLLRILRNRHCLGKSVVDFRVFGCKAHGIGRNCVAEVVA